MQSSLNQTTIFLQSSMESHKLEIILHSAKDLFDVKFFGTMDPYAVVWIAGDGKESKPRTTAVAKKGASSPIWNCPMQFNDVPMQNNYTLFCEIKHDGKLFDRDIGNVQVPFADLLAGNGSGERLSYPVKTSSGEVQGEIIVSHKFSKPIGEKDGNCGGSKVDGGPRKKVKGKKRQRKKVEKGGTLKRIVGNVVTKVVAETALLAGTVALAFALGDFDESGPSLQAETEVEEDDGDEDDEEYEDDDEDEEEEEEEDEYQEGEDEDEY
ncbi:hypothetical protein L6452_17982 [Arctium lappa]|uniref:Uncharacterized protein n=1 Tax=Arctium lappa TaxID=4217 RepID=A0ACB9C4Y7_ARCLA|nr:hypothetical protein L6452_17982 [Arctium lappa]